MMNLTNTKTFRSVLAVILIAVITSCESKITSDEKETSATISCLTCGPNYFSMQNIPKSENYPIPADTIESWVQKRDGHATRIHAWNLFAELMDTVTSKRNTQVWRWRTWPTATQAYAVNTSEEEKQFNGHHSKSSNLLQVNKKNTTEEIDLPPPGYRVPSEVCKIIGQDSTSAAGCTVPINGCQFQNNGDILIAGVIYNQPAFDHIRNQKLYDWDNLVSLWTNSYGNQNWQDREIPTFPSEAVVLKPMLWPVKQSGYTPLPVFPLECYNRDMGCDTVNGELRYSGFEEQRVWKNAVAISPNVADKGKTIPEIEFMYDVFTDTSFTTPLGPNIYKNVPVHTLDEFYYWQVNEEELNAMTCVDLAIINQSSYWAYGKPFEAGDYLALVAMHVITKEMPSWTFQSVWWDNTSQAQGSKFAKMRSDTTDPPMPDAFNSYLMTSTYGMNDSGSNTNEWPVAFNPYIELAAAHPINTNCRNCHQRGAFPASLAQREAIKLKIENYGSYLNPAAGNPTALDTFYFGNKVMDSLLIMDYQWAISDRVQPPSESNSEEKK